jgi:hypothetical protein
MLPTCRQQQGVKQMQVGFSLISSSFAAAGS